MLGLPPLPRTLEAALRDIEHERQHVRLSALRDLVRLADGPARPRALAALGRVLLRDASAELRADAAVALADSSASEARAELLAALEDAHLRVRQMALVALGEIAEPGDAEIQAALRPFLAHEQAALRFQALMAFERLAGADAGPELVRATRDSDVEVASMAFRLSERRFLDVDPPPELVDSARRVAAGTPTAASTSAALFLAARGDRSGGSVLVGALAGRVPVSGETDLQAVVEAVAELGLEEARPALRRRAFGAFGMRADGVGWHACIALARLGDERARRTIVKRLRAWTRDARTLAVVAAGRARVHAAREVLLGFRNDPERADPDAVEEALHRIEGVE
jgi:HEAT repeat protein